MSVNVSGLDKYMDRFDVNRDKFIKHDDIPWPNNGQWLFGAFNLVDIHVRFEYRPFVEDNEQ